VGGIGSEFAQGFVNPNRVFDINDIVCNIAGSGLAIGLSAWYHKRLLDRKREARYKMLRSNVSNSASQGTELQDIEAQIGLEVPSSSQHESSNSNEEPVLLKEVEPEPLA
jgi:hypothetical protein